MNPQLCTCSNGINPSCDIHSNDARLCNAQSNIGNIKPQSTTLCPKAPESKDALEGLALKAEDFQKVYGPGQGGPKDDLYFDFSAPGREIGASVLAAHVNELLRERLSPILTELEALRALRSEVEKAVGGLKK